MPGRAADVTVWRIALDPARGPDSTALAELAEAERARAARFATDALRNRWLTAHVALRRILAQHLGVSPHEIAYTKGEAGKPFLAHPAEPSLAFNFSDSGDLALVAVSRGGPIGVDVEACRPQPDIEAVAQSHFSAEEATALRALPAAARLAAFYRIWTRKEAYLKALGAGLSYGLGRFAVTHTADDVRVTQVDADSVAASRWSLEAVPVPSGFEAAVARVDQPMVLRTVDWPAA